MDYNKERCGLAISRLREQENMTGNELASFLMLPEEGLEKIEAGIRMPDEIELLMLSNYFHVYPDALARGEVKPRRTDNELLVATRDLLTKLEEVQKLMVNMQDVLIGKEHTILESGHCEKQPALSMGI